MSIWTIIIALIVFGVIVIVHEMGHFFTAKFFGVTVHEFAVGMGPKIFSTTKNETDYSVRALPLGGYIRMEGEDEGSEDPNGFNNKHPLKRMAIIFAGPFMNFIFAFLLFSMLYMMVGVPVNTVGGLIEGMPAIRSELQEGDRIISIEGTRTSSWTDVTDTIGASEDEILTFEVQRDSQTLMIDVETVREGGRTAIGISPKYERAPGISISYGFKQTVGMLKDMLTFLGQLFTGRSESEGVVGPIGIISAVGDAARTGFANVLFLAAVISLNLGLINLLPIPALDGSRIIFQFIELVRGKKIDPEKEGTIHLIGMALLLLLMVFVTYKDILRIFN